MAHLSQFGSKILITNNKIRCHTFDWEPAKILEPVIREEYKIEPWHMISNYVVFWQV